MESVVAESALPVNPDLATNSGDNSMETEHETNQVDNDDEGEGCSDSLFWWKDLAERALGYSDDSLQQWSTVDQFQRYCAHKYHKKEIDEANYIGSCCVHLLYNILQYPSNERDLNSKINDLAKSLSGRFSKVPPTYENDEADSSKAFCLADCVLPSLEPTDLASIASVSDTTGKTYGTDGVPMVGDMEMMLLVNIIDLLKILIHSRSNKAPSTNRVRLGYVQSNEKWMVSLAYLVAYLSYDFCGIRSWKTIGEVTFQLTKCFKKVRFLKINAGLALLGLEILSSESTWSEGDNAIEGLTATVVSELLASTRYVLLLKFYITAV